MYRSLFSSIVSNIMDIIKLSESGLEFQTNIIMRNMYELCFLFLALIINKDLCLKYFDTKNNNNEYEVWSKNLRIRKINKIIYKYEISSKIQISWAVYKLKNHVIMNIQGMYIIVLINVLKIVIQRKIKVKNFIGIYEEQVIQM